MRTLRVRWGCSGEPLLPSELVRLLPRISPLAMAARSTCIRWIHQPLPLLLLLLRRLDRHHAVSTSAALSTILSSQHELADMTYAGVACTGFT
jgi:hypothetical protein